MTNAYLDQDAKWVNALECARAFATPWEAVRYCAELGLRGADMLVCYMSPKPNMRVPVS